MRLVRNPSYTHSPEIKNKFNQYKDVIFMKDHSQYTANMIDALLHSIQESKKLNMKKNHILWLTMQLWNDRVDSKKRIGEDYLPLVKIHFINQNLLKPIEYYSTISELNQAINDLSEDEEIVSEKDYDIFYERDGWFIAMPHTTKASCNLGKGTDWCTARTKSQNLFLSYVGKYSDDIILFYVINTRGNTKSNTNDKLSVGFEDGVPVFDGANGGLTVNAINEGISLDEFGKILGEELAKEFLIKMDEKAQSIKGKHPAKKEMERIAKSTEKYLKKISEFKNEEHLMDFKTSIAEYPISEGIQEILANDPYEAVRRTLASNNSLVENVCLILAKDIDVFVRQLLAENGNITERIQLVLIEDVNEYVLKHLAGNKNISEKAQLELAIDTYLTTRTNLAENPNITENTQLFLTKDKNEAVRRYLSKNMSITEKVQIALTKDKEIWVKRHLAKNEAITEKVQLILANDKNEWVRKDLRMNPNLTEKVKIILMQDTD